MGPQVRRSQPDALAPAIADGSAARGRHPYSLAFMPWLTELAPSTSYVLVVRDGRDVAMPTNLAADKMLELARPLLPVGRVRTRRVTDYQAVHLETPDMSFRAHSFAIQVRLVTS